MSALRTIDVTQPPGGGETVQVPKSYMPEMDRALLDGSPRLMDFPASAGQFAPSTLSQILIPPTANRYILGGSSYLNFRLTLAQAIGFTPASGYTITSYFSGGPTKSAAALIDRITITGAGTTLADINNYYIWHNIILAHASNQDYQQAAKVMENAFTAIDSHTGTAAQSTSLQISLPLAVGLFNTVKAFPLWAFNGPLVINIYWSSYARSIGVCPQIQSSTDQAAHTITSLTPTGTGWTGDQLSFRCMTVDVDPEYIASQRAQLQAGRLLVYQYDQVGGMQTNAGSASINFGINCSSLLGVLGCQLMSNDTTQIATSPAEGPGSTYAGSWGFSANEVDSIRVFRDGTQMTSFPICAAQRDDAFPVLQQTLGILFSTSNSTLCRKLYPANANVPAAPGNFKVDPNCSFPPRSFNLSPLWGMGAVRGGSVFAPAAFVWGAPSRKCSDDNISNQGVYCQQLQLIVDNGQSNSGTHYLFYLFSSALAIDASGNCVVKR